MSICCHFIWFLRVTRNHPSSLHCEASTPHRGPSMTRTHLCPPSNRTGDARCPTWKLPPASNRPEKHPYMLDTTLPDAHVPGPRVRRSGRPYPPAGRTLSRAGPGFEWPLSPSPVPREAPVSLCPEEATHVPKSRCPQQGEADHPPLRRSVREDAPNRPAWKNLEGHR